MAVLRTCKCRLATRLTDSLCVSAGHPPHCWNSVPVINTCALMNRGQGVDKLSVSSVGQVEFTVDYLQHTSSCFAFFFIPSILRKMHNRIKQLRSKTDFVMQREITVMSMNILQSSKWYMYFYCLILFSLIKKITIPFQTNCKWRIKVWSFINLKHYIIFFYLLPVYQKYSKKKNEC